MDRYLIEENSKKSRLSRQEINTLVYLIRGRSAKQTAKILQLSPRTVETFLQSAKRKLNCNSTSELIDKIIKIKLFDFDYLNSHSS